MRCVRRWYTRDYDVDSLPLTGVDLYSGMPGRTLTQDALDSMPVILTTTPSLSPPETHVITLTRNLLSDQWGYFHDDTSNSTVHVLPKTPASQSGLRELDRVTDFYRFS